MLAQLLVLALALITWPLLSSATDYFWTGAIAPIYVVFTRLNIFLMVMVLLPIGPFDGQRAWRIEDRGLVHNRRALALEPVIKPLEVGIAWPKVAFIHEAMIVRSNP